MKQKEEVFPPLPSCTFGSYYGMPTGGTRLPREMYLLQAGFQDGTLATGINTFQYIPVTV